MYYKWLLGRSFSLFDRWWRVQRTGWEYSKITQKKKRCCWDRSKQFGAWLSQKPPKGKKKNHTKMDFVKIRKTGSFREALPAWRILGELHFVLFSFTLPSTSLQRSLKGRKHKSGHSGAGQDVPLLQDKIETSPWPARLCFQHSGYVGGAEKRRR